MSYHDRGIRWRMVIGIGGTGIIAALILNGQGSSGLVAIDLSALAESMPFEQKYLWVLAAPMMIPLLLPVFKLDIRSRLTRHYRSQTYAITNRRLLIFEGEKLLKVKGRRVASYTPEEIHKLEYRERSPGCSDVIFARYVYGNSRNSAPNLLDVERGFVGFKGQPDAQEILRKVEAWAKSLLEKEVEAVAEFVEAASSVDEASPADGMHVVENGTLGLKLVVPPNWKVQVRLKKKPFGSTFIDREKWFEVGESDRWNLARVEGPRHCTVEIEVFESQPTVSFDTLAESKMADAVSGEVIDSNPDFEMSGLGGFMVTRRSDIRNDDEINSAILGGSMISRQLIVLQGNDRQVVINATWTQESPELERAVHAVVDSVGIS